MILIPKKNSLSIKNTFIRFKKQDLIQPPKTTKSTRIVYIHEDLSQLLQEYIHNSELKNRLFPTTRYYLNKMMRKGYQTANVKRIKIHDLRHSHASHLINLGVPAIEIAERLGHENIQTTLGTYAHLWPNKQEEIAHKLQEIQDNSKGKNKSLENSER